MFISNLLQEKEEEEEVEVKLISSVINAASSNVPDMETKDFFPEFEDLLSGEIEFPLPDDKFDDATGDRVYEIEMANNASELERMRRLVKELVEREMKLEKRLEHLTNMLAKKD